EETCEYLLLAGEHAPLVGREVVPCLDPARTRRQRSPLRHHSRGELPSEELLAPGVPTLVEQAAVGLHPFGCDVVGRMHGAEREIQEERLAGRRLLLVLHHAYRLVRQVLTQVVARARWARRLDVVVVTDQVRCPVVRVTLEEPVVALEPGTERPGVERSRGRSLPAWRQVPLAHGQ